MKNRFKSFALVLAGIAAGLLLGEFLVRTAVPNAAAQIRLYRYMELLQGKFTRFDPVVGWTGIADVTGSLTWPDTRSHVEQNRYGFRGTAHPFDRTDRRRIVFLGDSFVWGFGADERDLFSRRIEARAEPPIEIVNLGVSGYGNDQMLLQWQQIGHLWNPDEVWLFITFTTDLTENTQRRVYEYNKPVFQEDPDGRLRLVPVTAEQKSTLGPRIDVEPKRQSHPFLSALLQHSDLACLVTKFLIRAAPVRRYLEDEKIIPVQQHGYVWEYEIYDVKMSPSMAAKWRRMEQILQLLAEDVGKRGIRLRLIVVPSVVQVYPRLWETFVRQHPGNDPMKFYPEFPNRIIAAMGKRLHAPVIDLLPGFRDAGRSRDDLYFPFNRHWTAAGHQIAAALLLEELKPLGQSQPPDAAVGG
jgi:lysophospholipase L1-like esterase